MGEPEMRLAKTAKPGAKGWVGVKAVKGASKALGDTARKITGVKDVNNLLHTGTNSG
jgi:hypothetical protein